MGIYVHVPFCRSKCFYCGFYSVASTKLREEYVNALCREIELRKDYLLSKKTDTLYFGGGTPSYLAIDELTKIAQKLESVYQFAEDAERTIELNPEDITIEKLNGLRQLGFNRLSIGIQSFNDSVLKYINRTHTAKQAIEAVNLAKSCGFDNVSIDLIIGLPGYSMADLENDLKILSSLYISHVSVYILSIDSNSVFEKRMQKGEFRPEDEESVVRRWGMVADYLQTIGFEHYEISNFARDGKYARHNTAYWQQKEYIGLGPSAHSFDLSSRQWNIANLKIYIESLNKSSLNFEKETLSESDKYNEYIMTNLRTMWGADMDFLRERGGRHWKRLAPKIDRYIQNEYAQVRCGRLSLSEKGWLVSDSIFSDLFM